MALEVGSLDFESNDNITNQLRYETLNEKATSLTSFDDLKTYLQSQFPANEANPEVNFSQPSLSSGQKQMNKINAEINTNPLLVSRELIPKQYFKCATNQYSSTNQDSLAVEYGKMQHNMGQMNPESNRYQPYGPFEFSPLELFGYESNQYMDKNQQKVSLYNKEIEIYSHLENQKKTTTHLKHLNTAKLNLVGMKTIHYLIQIKELCYLILAK
ncbi:hypothetical protein TNIN_312761 [Trichonephila inaurata madagascariensis]|uniref:Uncharacterized protein n=1 Tax=Trichonephila inaurata madagascariensis TaxID=2747483 RepID=A0A8X6YR75_9ARAC|nr:hypothetical protein TNIN_312761 [Trichonephila inaurata madagascariensis]